ncbi:MAG: tRNA (adenosine(37)-N6)-threonylcarbamoyltransferase complex dimerization subunit type 1 TsaB [Rikenellaceae bacterium]
MALILCIETGTEICSVALALDGKVISLRESSLGRDHAKNLGVFIDEILRGTEYKSSDLDAVAVSKGPGSYTGLRIGVSISKALCYALNIPLIGIGSLESLTNVFLDDFQAGILDVEDLSKAVLCPMIDARRMEVYTQLFSPEAKAISEIEAHILTEDSFSEQLNSGKQLLVFGDGASKSLDVIHNENIKYLNVAPSSRGLARLAEQAYLRGEKEDTAYFEPLYLKDFMIHKSNKKFF